MKTIDAEIKFLKYCQDRKLSPETLRWYTIFIEKLIKSCPELPSDPEPVEALIGSYPGEFRRLGCYRALRAFFNWVCHRFNLENPFRSMKSPKVPKSEKQTLTLDQMRRLLDVPTERKAVKALLFALCDTGARVGEIANIKHSDIGEDTVTLHGKTGSRVVPVSPNVREMLLDLKDIDFRGSKSKDIKPDCVFQVDTQQLSRWVTLAFKHAGIDGFKGAHCLRHSYCTLYKGDIMSLKTITGHSSWQMLEHYRHHRLENAQEQHSKLSPLAQIHKNGDNHAQTEVVSSPVVIDNTKTELFQQIEDKILVAIPANLAIGKGLTLHISLS
jgi:integrase